MTDLTLNKLQEYLKNKDFQPELKKDYFLKLTEEVGELSAMIRKNIIAENEADLKNSLQEELVDVLYYTVCLANVYDVDLSRCFVAKEKLNDKKYGNHFSDLLTKPNAFVNATKGESE